MSIYSLNSRERLYKTDINRLTKFAYSLIMVYRTNYKFN